MSKGVPVGIKGFVISKHFSLGVVVGTIMPPVFELWSLKCSGFYDCATVLGGFFTK